MKRPSAIKTAVLGLVMAAAFALPGAHAQEPSCKDCEGASGMDQSDQIERVQQVSTATGSDTTSLSLAWPAPTEVGNLVVLAVHAGWDSEVGDIGVPAGWTLIERADNTGRRKVSVALYYREAAPSQSGLVTVTVRDPQNPIKMTLAEYRGILAQGSLDQHARSVGEGNTPGTGYSATTTQPHELWLGAIAQSAGYSQCEPTDGFGRVHMNRDGASTLGLYQRIATATGRAGLSVSLRSDCPNPDPYSSPWAGVVATFRAAAAVPTTPYSTPTPTLTPRPTRTPIVCSESYRGKIAAPVVEPTGEIVVSPASVVRFARIGAQEDELVAVVNGQSIPANRNLTLNPGRNVVDFVVIGEGEVHYWHAVFTVDGGVVFEHQQARLEPPISCSGELYRYRLIFRVGTADPVTATATLTALPTPSPGATSTAPPTATNEPTQVPSPTEAPTPTLEYRPAQCPGLAAKVPAPLIAQALVDPARVGHWMERCDPGRPFHPLANGYRTRLQLLDMSKPFDRVANGLIFKCGCR